VKRELAVASVLMALSVTAAYGKECKGIQFPDQAQVQGSPLTLNGLGLRKATAFKVNVYVAALYADKPTNDPRAILESSAPNELILQFVRGVSANDLKKAWEEGFAKNSPGQLSALKDRIAMLNGWMPDVKSGQRMTFIRMPGRGVEVDTDGTVKGTIEGDDFAKAFLSIWLGENPPNPELKSGLLGGACS
jgi:hypothetical protein